MCKRYGRINYRTVKIKPTRFYQEQQHGLRTRNFQKSWVKTNLQKIGFSQIQWFKKLYILICLPLSKKIKGLKSNKTPLIFKTMTYMVKKNKAVCLNPTSRNDHSHTSVIINFC
jgi:hypothetical protein